MIRVLLFAMMICLYFHGLSTGFQLAARAWEKKDKVVHIPVTGRDVIGILAMFACAIMTCCFIRL